MYTCPQTGDGKFGNEANYFLIVVEFDQLTKLIIRLKAS